MTTLQETPVQGHPGTPPLWHGAGIIVIDKPRGPSSHQVAAWVGRMLGCQVGHAGTLDPQVSGVLLVMLGNAVRLAPLLLQHDKEYICLMRLHGDVDRDRIEQVAAEFTGRTLPAPAPEKCGQTRCCGSAPSTNWRFSTLRDVWSCSGQVRCRDLHPLALPPHGTCTRCRCTHGGTAPYQFGCL